MERLYSTPIIIIEGHYIFTNMELMDHMDCRIYLDTDDDVRLSRLVLKSSKNNSGKDLEPLKELLKKYER